MCAQANPLFTLVCLAATIYTFVLLVWVVLSWISFAGWRPPSSGPARVAFDLLEDVVRPVLTPLRKIVPPAGMFDLSVIVAFVILFVIRQVVCG